MITKLAVPDKHIVNLSEVRTVFVCGRCVLKPSPVFHRQRAAGSVGDKLSGKPGDPERREVQPRGLEHHLLLYAGDLPKHQPSRVRPEPVSTTDLVNLVSVQSIQKC